MFSASNLHMENSVTIPPHGSDERCRETCSKFTQLFNEEGRNVQQEEWANNFQCSQFLDDQRLPYRPSGGYQRLGFFSPSQACYRSYQFDSNKIENFWNQSYANWREIPLSSRFFGSHLGNHLEQYWYDVNRKAAELRSQYISEEEATANKMALTSGRRVCKLDAICAKLNKINKETSALPERDENTEEKPGTIEDNIEQTENAPTDLSRKCLNNNLIEKVDLYQIDKNSNDTNGLDLTKSKTAKADSSKREEESNCLAVKNGNIVNEDDEIEKETIEDVDKKENKLDIVKHESKSETSQTPKSAPIPSSRRKSRKAATPRNIAQVRDFYDEIDEKDELADYKINNQNTNFPPEVHDETSPKDSGINLSRSQSRLNDFNDEDESNSSVLDYSKSSDLSNSNKSLNHSRNSRASLQSSDLEGAPLDLSGYKGGDGNTSMHNGELSSDDEDFFHPDRNLVIDEDMNDSRSEFSVPCSPREGSNESKDTDGENAAHLKDYAENTMNEFISMFGFGGPGGKTIPRNGFSTIVNQAQSSQLPSLASLSQGGASMFQNQPITSDDDGSHDGSLDQFGRINYANFAGKVNEEGKLQNDRFTSSSSFINAVFSSVSGPGGEPLSPGKTMLPNYSKYLKRYNNGNECGGQHCLDLSYKEHYHCIDCSFQVFIKKEEMVRHYKWHKKREESLQHGFLRYSPLDNCTKRFGPCTHNGKQTHYHCLQNTCDKVYISTSDVQMHANYHRKDSAIMSEGFQRFRATEDCGTMACAFYGQRTTHFHCLRSDCRFTFKNKADMEKHKSYHQKDEVLGRDGFKKFMKYEHCMHRMCRYSKVSNHIHCIRSGCDYVLHSTAQLYSHKRKHERRDFENAYKCYRDTQGGPQTNLPVPVNHQQLIAARNHFGPNSGPLSHNIPTPVIQTLSSVSGIKRPSDSDQNEPIELKRPKIEPMDADASSSGRSSPANLITPKVEYDSMDEEETDLSADGKTQASNFSMDQHQTPNMSHKLSALDQNLNLNSSLTLPIPGVASLNPIESQSGLAASPHALQPSLSHIQHLMPSSIMGSQAPSTLNNSMPGTLTGALVTMNTGTLMTVQTSGTATLLQPPKSIYTERREKDDSWKTYLVRYTANDPCNPRCQYLYKDHYHCKMEGCLVLFKSKDGVREHARFHELQDRITPIAYRTFGTSEPCPDVCQYSEKEKHFHCIWTGCTHVVPYVGPTFGRLEHYRIHEYARAAAGKSYSRSPKGGTVIEDNSMRRRGRPPKYPKIDLPKIPKVELTDEEIRQSHVGVHDFETLGKVKVLNGFRIFSSEDPCPDDQCAYIGILHYHCARPRCFTITDRVDVLNLHAKDFHSFVKILEGFEFFDRNVSCRRAHCVNNMTNRHFHCTRPKCDYSFIRHSTMAQHDKKHGYSELGAQSAGGFPKSDTVVSPTGFRRDVPIMPATVNSMITAAINSVSAAAASKSPISDKPGMVPVITSTGTLLPVSSMSLPIFLSQAGTSVAGVPQGSIILQPNLANLSASTMAALGSPVNLGGSSSQSLSDGPLALTVSSIQALPPTKPNATNTTAPLITAGSAALAVSAINSSKSHLTYTPTTNPLAVNNSSAPLTVLLQKGVNQIPIPSWNELRFRMHYALSQNCGRPFCKLKKKDHYHCYDCNQAFSDPARLRSHIGKHGINFKRQDQERAPSSRKTFSQTSPRSQVKPILPRVANIPAMPPLDQLDSEMDIDEAKCLAQGAEMPANDSDAEDELKSSSLSSSSLNLNPSTFSQMISKAQEHNPRMSPDIDDMKVTVNDHLVKMEVNSDVEENVSDSNEQKMDLSSRSGRKITKTKREGFMNSGEINLSKQRRVSSPRSSSAGGKTNKINDSPVQLTSPKVGVPLSSSSRGLKDESVPSGYSRWRYNEECCYNKCAYRHSVTHFHCIRGDCGYGFSDRSRLVQHSLRHERIDSITGGELQQYRINQDCEIADCEYKLKMSHFHCKRCPYCCTDSSKVLTHRKYHSKLDNITNQGFQKYAATDDCEINVCPYARKQNHFHCLVDTCQAAVLGPAQMNSHKIKHSAETNDNSLNELNDSG